MTHPRGATTTARVRCVSVLLLAGVVLASAPIARAQAPVLDRSAGVTAGRPVWDAKAAATERMMSVHAVDGSHAFAVGYGGAIRYTSDSGATWTAQASGTTAALYGCDAIAGAAWAVGDGGTILHTSNGGTDWAPQASGTTKDLFAVDFASPMVGWAVGYEGTILRTIDGGATWTAAASPTMESLQAVSFADSTVGWAVGQNGVIFRSVNGGSSWQQQTAPTTDSLYSVSSVDRTTAWAVGENGRILLTTDGGANWVPVPTGLLPTLVSVDFTDRNSGWAVGTSGTMLRTVDGGRSWKTVSADTNAALQSVDFSDDGRVGHSVGATGTATTCTFSDVPGVVTRAAGADRYVAAAAMARKGWDAAGAKTWVNVRHVVVVNGETGKEADLLSAVGLAGAYDAPVLLVKASGVPASTKSLLTEIANRRKVENTRLAVHIVGGPASVPDARWNEIRAIPGVDTRFDRVSGADRYAVSANIAARIVGLKGSADVPGAILVAADNPAAFYDAFAAAPISYATAMPMLAVKKASIPGAVQSVLGGALKGKPRWAASSSAYIGSVPAAGAQRLTTSSNRYTAATQIGGRAVTEGWLTATNTGVAANLADALGGAALLGERGGVLLYTDSTRYLQTPTAAFIKARGKGIDAGLVLGGTASVPLDAEKAFRALIQ